MLSFRLAVAVALVTASLGVHSAFAFSFDNTTANYSNGSARFADPDDTIPAAHISDNGQPSNPSGYFFQSQSSRQSGASFGFAPFKAEPDAFERAQERMQQ